MAKSPTPQPKATPAKSAASVTAPGKPAVTLTGQGTGVSEEAIRLRAYQRWEAAGCPCGDDMRFWLEAEKELRKGR